MLSQIARYVKFNVATGGCKCIVGEGSSVARRYDGIRSRSSKLEISPVRLRRRSLFRSEFASSPIRNVSLLSSAKLFRKLANIAKGSYLACAFKVYMIFRIRALLDERILKTNSSEFLVSLYVSLETRGFSIYTIRLGS